MLSSALNLLSIRMENNRGVLKAIGHHHPGRCVGCPRFDSVINQLLDHNLSCPLQCGLYASVGYVGLSHPLQTAAPPSSLAADPMPQCSLRPPRPSQQSSYLVMLSLPLLWEASDYSHCPGPARPGPHSRLPPTRFLEGKFTSEPAPSPWEPMAGLSYKCLRYKFLPV